MGVQSGVIHSEKDAWHRGSYKTTSNSVAAFDEVGGPIGIMFETATPFETPRLMSELVTWLDQVTGEHRLHPLLTIGIFGSSNAKSWCWRICRICPYGSSTTHASMAASASAR